MPASVRIVAISSCWPDSKSWLPSTATVGIFSARHLARQRARFLGEAVVGQIAAEHEDVGRLVDLARTAAAASPAPRCGRDADRRSPRSGRCPSTAGIPLPWRQGQQDVYRATARPSCCVERGERLLEHAAMGGGDRQAEVRRGPLARELEECAGAPAGRAPPAISAGRAGFRPRAASSCWASTDFDSKPRAIPYCYGVPGDSTRMPLPEPIIGSTCTLRAGTFSCHSGGRVSALLPRACLPPRARWLRHAGGPNRPAPDSAQPEPSPSAVADRRHAAEDRRARRQPDRRARPARDAGVSGAAAGEDRTPTATSSRSSTPASRATRRRAACGGSTGRSQGTCGSSFVALGANDGLRGLSGRRR